MIDPKNEIEKVLRRIGWTIIILAGFGVFQVIEIIISIVARLS